MTTRTTAAMLGSILIAQGALAAQPEEVEPTPESCPPHACCFDSGAGSRELCEIWDFLEFQMAYVSGDPCAIDMDISTGVGVADIFDFLAFQQEFMDGLLFGFHC